MPELEALDDEILPRRKKNGTPEPDPAARVLAQADASDALDVRTWLDSFSGQDISITVHRMSPRTWTLPSGRSVQINGVCGKYSEFIDDERLREDFGGGQFKLIVNGRNSKGQSKIVGTRTVMISGMPKLDEFIAAEGSSGGGSNEPNSVVNAAMKVMQDEVRRSVERTERAESRSAFDPNLLQMIQAPLTAQLHSFEKSQQDLQRILAAKDAQILELITKRDAPPPGGTFQDKILSSMLDNESTRLDTLRERHDSELRQLKDGHRQELERERDRLANDMKSRERQHERELDAMKDSQRVASEAIKAAHETRIDGLKSENARLERELGALKLEVAELRARKDKSLIDQTKEIVSVREALQALGGGSDDEEPKGLLERFATGILENPEAIGQIVGGVKQSINPTPPPQAPPQLPPVRRRMLKRRPQVSMEIPGAEGAPPAGGGLSLDIPTPAASLAPPPVVRVKPPKLDQAEVDMAVRFIENAITSGTPASVFAASAKVMIPGDILKYIEIVGVDQFLVSLSGKLGQDSRLRTPEGRAFIKEVARILLEGA